MKERAGLNRTLTLTDAERPLLAARNVQLAAPARPEELVNQIINQDLFAVLPLLPPAWVDLLIIDPPYNLAKNYHGNSFNKMEGAEYEAWLESWLLPLLPVLKPAASVYVCCDWASSLHVHQVLARHLVVRNRITWEREKGRGAARNWKNNLEDIYFATLDEAYVFNVEAVKMKRRVQAPYTQNGQPKDWQAEDQGNFRLTHPSNLWTDISIPFWSMPENTDHPTQKPEKLIAKLILASSTPGQLVFDPFSGSGTTAVVARKLGRNYCGVELNEEYCLWAQKRLLLAEADPSIQGYHDGVFWERNASPGKKKKAKAAAEPGETSQSGSGNGLP